MGPDGLDGRREVLRPEHQVERQPECLQGREAPLDRRRPQPPRGVGLSQGLVADADERRVARQRAERLVEVGPGQVDPADDAGHEFLGPGVLEEHAGLLGVVDHLDEDDALDRCPGHRGPQVAEAEVPADRGSRRDPAVVLGPQVPDVHVRVDDGVGHPVVSSALRA